MTEEDIQKLVLHKSMPGNPSAIDLKETHISWVLLTEQFAFKIKKPIKLPFLDFSSLEKRKYYCEQELVLNKRFSPAIYLSVLPVKKLKDRYAIGTAEGITEDFCVQLKKLDVEKELKRLLVAGKVNPKQIIELAKTVAVFHASSPPLLKDFNKKEEQKKFEAILMSFSQNEFPAIYFKIIEDAVKASYSFIEKNEKLFAQRYENGYVKDCHGDLHSGNIFLYPKPVLFDCIEFNKDFREIDTLSEIAFPAMDLERYNKPDLSNLFVDYYLKYSHQKLEEASYKLLTYYKMYRANIRAKVNLIKIKEAVLESEKEAALSEAKNYLSLLATYTQQLV